MSTLPGVTKNGTAAFKPHYYFNDDEITRDLLQRNLTLIKVDCQTLKPVIFTIATVGKTRKLEIDLVKQEALTFSHEIKPRDFRF